MENEKQINQTLKRMFFEAPFTCSFVAVVDPIRARAATTTIKRGREPASFGIDAGCHIA
jgi:hypothetical protein